ncbi:hypothetical protein M758_2G226200 [Ceratodon purpureus]|nr:hypothetical protein M758_2G226200 [Ceratodon purpureus]
MEQWAVWKLHLVINLGVIVQSTLQHTTEITTHGNGATVEHVGSAVVMGNRVPKWKTPTFEHQEQINSQSGSNMRN